MKTNEQIGKNVRILRAKLSLSQAEVAKRTDVSQAYIGKIEAGKSNITMEVLGNLAEALEVTPNELVNEINITTQAA